MTDSPRGNLEDRMDRYARGELTAAEARELAQQSLDDAELFEELTVSGVAKAALATPPQPSKIIPFPRKARFAAAAAAAAAAAVAVISLHSPSRPTVSPLTPALSSSALPGQPVLLAGGLQPAPGGRESAPVFRGGGPASRNPRPAGAIVSVEEGIAAIDLGSLDGVMKESELAIYRDEQSTQPIGRLAVTTVFRERSRGRILAGQRVQVRDRVRVSSAAYAGAVLEQVDALFSRGDMDAAQRMAEQAAAPAASGAALNRLAVLYMLRGDYKSAEAPLNQASAISPRTDAAYAEIANNLAVLAEIRGDRRKAVALYTDALHASSAQQRGTVERNLARLQGVR